VYDAPSKRERKMANDVAFADPMDFGMGIDSVTLRPRNPNAVAAPSLKTVRGSNDAQDVEFAFFNTETMENFENVFSFNSNMSATYGLFGGSASFEFGKSQKFHSFFAVDWNRNVDLASIGAHIVSLKSELLEARKHLPPNAWLGFNVAIAIFSDKASGGGGEYKTRY
jgi:hypothetical protein